MSSLSSSYSQSLNSFISTRWSIAITADFFLLLFFLVKNVKKRFGSQGRDLAGEFESRSR